jgi:hypothetical protein
VSRQAWLRPFSRRIGTVLLWAALAFGAAALANLAGIHALGGIAGWEQWLRAHAGHFFVWRLFLYAATVTGWVWMRRRLLRREPDAGPRLRRLEIVAALAIVALEISRLLRD